MTQQIMIIGLGQFGMSLTRALSDRNVEVLAVDINKNLVEEAAMFATEAVAINATDEVELAQLKPSQRDAVVCAIGDDSKEASIICTALLRQMGVKFIVARSSDKTHERILKLVGAHLIINPEMEFGKRFANRLLYRHIVSDTPLRDDLVLTELVAQPVMIGKTLRELKLPARFGLTVVGIRLKNERSLMPVSPDFPLPEASTLVIVSRESAVAKYLDEVQS